MDLAIEASISITENALILQDGGVLLLSGRGTRDQFPPRPSTPAGGLLAQTQKELCRVLLAQVEDFDARINGRVRFASNSPPPLARTFAVDPDIPGWVNRQALPALASDAADALDEYVISMANHNNLAALGSTPSMGNDNPLAAVQGRLHGGAAHGIDIDDKGLQDQKRGDTDD
jgi:hypothetical protein